MTDYQEGDKVVFETSDGYTTLGIIEEMPPWSHNAIDVVEETKVKMRLSDSIPSFGTVHPEKIEGLASDIEADVHTL